MSKHTKQSLIESLQQFFQTHNRVPTAHETMYLSDIPRYKIFEYHFGSWKSAVEAAGLSVVGKQYPTQIHTNCSQCNIELSIQPHLFNKSTSKRFFCSQSCACSYNNTHKKHGTRRSKFEQYVQEQLSNNFPNLEVIYNSKSIISSDLDIYIPALKLAIEINGIVHYEPIYGPNKLTKIQNNDNQKTIKCYEQGIELATINVSKCSHSKQHPTYYQYIHNLVLTNIGRLN